MSELNFPSSPSAGDTFTQNATTWRYDGLAWVNTGTYIPMAGLHLAAGTPIITGSLVFGGGSMAIWCEQGASRSMTLGALSGGQIACFPKDTVSDPGIDYVNGSVRIWANRDGVGHELNLYSDGRAWWDGSLLLAAGTEAAPALQVGVVGCGFYLVAPGSPSENRVGLALGGTKRWDFGPTSSITTVPIEFNAADGGGTFAKSDGAVAADANFDLTDAGSWAGLALARDHTSGGCALILCDVGIPAVSIVAQVGNVFTTTDPGSGSPSGNKWFVTNNGFTALRFVNRFGIAHSITAAWLSAIGKPT